MIAVVHGDIKPSNILVIRNDDGNTIPNYRTLATPYTNCFVKLTISRPLNITNGSDVKKTGIYSFGLCLWVLLKEDLEKSGISFNVGKVKQGISLAFYQLAPFADYYYRYVS